MVGDQYCTYCGLFHTSTQTNSFSMLFSNYQTDNNTCPFMSSSFASSSSSVDCTLSLGTPSTRLSNNIVNDNNINNDKAVQHERRRSSTYMPNFCWDMLQYPKNTPSLQPAHKTISGTDILLARRCANCDTTSTPLWRNGPRGPKSLCNACGIRFKKEERRGKAATTTTGTGSAAIPHMINGSTSSFWAHHQHQSSQSSAHPCTSPSTFGSEFRFTDQDGSETGIPFISWRLDVTDCRPSLVHGFTR